MDILSHGLWAGAAYWAANRKFKKQISVKRAIFWGIFPDLFAFTIPFVWLFWQIIFNGINLADLPRPDAAEPAGGERLIFGNGDLRGPKKSVFYIVPYLYHLSHSVVIFSVIFGAATLLFYLWRNGRGEGFVPWTMGGWLIHILMDIPSHSYRFYPTPFLWPLSDLQVNGFSWAGGWFLAGNYGVVAVIYFLLWRARRVRGAFK